MAQKAKPTQKPAVRRKSQPKKIVESKVERTSAEILPPRSRKRLYPVTINGRDRMITVPTYSALKDDPQYTIDLPDGSPLAQVDATGKVQKPCKDC